MKVTISFWRIHSNASFSNQKEEASSKFILTYKTWFSGIKPNPGPLGQDLAYGNDELPWARQQNPLSLNSNEKQRVFFGGGNWGFGHPALTTLDVS